MAVFNMKVYLDCNVILDWACCREPFSIYSTKIMEMAENQQIEACVSGLVLANVHYLIAKTYNKPIADNFLSDFGNLYTFVNLSDNAIKQAIQHRYKDFEDDLHYFCAVENKIDVIITRNVKDFPQNDLIKVLTPQQFLDAQ